MYTIKYILGLVTCVHYKYIFGLVTCVHYTVYIGFGRFCTLCGGAGVGISRGILLGNIL